MMISDLGVFMDYNKKCKRNSGRNLPFVNFIDCNELELKFIDWLTDDRLINESVGLLILREYRHKRESKNRKYLGKEVLLIGSLTGFVSQAVIGLFLFNRTVNGMALLTFMFLGSLVLAHTVSIRRDSNEAVSR